jgi:hypothetical protein
MQGNRVKQRTQPRVAVIASATAFSWRSRAVPGIAASLRAAQ